MVFWLRLLWAALTSVVVRLAFRLSAFVVTFAATALVLALIASLGARAVVPTATSRLDRRWSESLAPMSTLTQRVPTTGANASALALEVAAAELGIDLAPAGAADRTRADLEHSVRFAVHDRDLESFARDLLVSERGLPSMAPQLIFFLQDFRPRIDAVTECLNGGAPPRWEVDLEQGFDAPVPDLAGQQALVRALLAESIRRWSGGEPEAAAAVLAAVWRLVQPTLVRPERRCLLSALYSLDLLLATLRGMDPPPAGWRERLDAVDLKDRYQHTLQTEAWNAARAGRSGSFVDHNAWWVRHLVDPVGRPFMVLAMQHQSEALRWSVDQLAFRTAAGIQRGPFTAEAMATIPRWNHVARRYLPEVESGWQRITRSAAGVELTLLVLQVHELDAAGDRQGLESMAGTRPSCARGYSWICTVLADRVELELDGEPMPEPDPGSLLLPLRASVEITVPPLAPVEVRDEP